MTTRRRAHIALAYANGARSRHQRSRDKTRQAHKLVALALMAEARRSRGKRFAPWIGRALRG